ncbi:hypothetical protein [Breoghania sp.]|uniref:hypothetical protein n=1 Tax=Breoghania sp. TaxID=2065378 RepID=UPI002AA69613|nr:hypothetical protein [Breoghania sp.]
MTTPRSQVREAVRAVLATAGESGFPTAAGARVYVNRSIPMDADADFPVILIRSGDETIDQVRQGYDGTARRVLPVYVEFYAISETAADDVDAGAFQIEAALQADRDGVSVIGAFAESCILQETAFDFAAEGDDEIHAAVMEFEVTYWTITDIAGLRPEIVMLGFVPDVGVGNEPEYVHISPGAGDV